MQNNIPDDLFLNLVILNCPLSTWAKISRLSRHHAKLVQEEAFWRLACRLHGYRRMIAGPRAQPLHVNSQALFQNNHQTAINWQRGRVQSWAQWLPDRLPQAPIIMIASTQLLAVGRNAARLHGWKLGEQPQRLELHCCAAICHADGWWIGDQLGQIRQLGGQSWQAHGQEITAFWTDGKRLRSGDLGGWVKEWSLPSRELVAAKFHGDSPIIHVGQRTVVNADGLVENEDQRFCLDTSVTTVVESENHLWLGCLDGSVRSTNGITFQLHDCAITALCLHRGHLLISGAASGLISIWRLIHELCFVSDIRAHRAAITSLWAEDGRIVSADLSGRLVVHYLAP